MWHDTYFTVFGGDDDVRFDRFMDGPEIDEEALELMFSDGSRLRIAIEGDPGLYMKPALLKRRASRFYHAIVRRLIRRAHDEVLDLDLGWQPPRHGSLAEAIAVLHRGEFGKELRPPPRGTL